MIKPLDNYLVLEEEAYKSESALILGDNPNLERQIIAKVIVIGPDVKKVKVGDRVILPRDNKIHVDVDDVFHWLVNADEVLGILL